MAGDDRSRAQGAQSGLLGVNDPSPVGRVNPQGRSPFLLVADHAGNRLPEALGTLGLDAADRARHIAWDIGTAALGEQLAHRLDAVLLRQIYSRLVVDCNRDPDAADAVPEISDGTVIAGNRALSAEARALRIAGIHAPYQRAIAAEIARRSSVGQPTVLISLHSFTPVMGGVARPWQIGILHDGAQDALARRLLDGLRGREGVIVGDNEPYVMDATDHTVPRHAFAAGLSYAEIEISQAELSSEDSIRRWCEILAQGLDAALSRR